uniref:Cytochrome c oxidase subunit 2 n=1 Tax=Phanerotoma flava TaxID=684660 RepID=D8WHA4_9HYME|nr:cytochrome c oxidase subunit II [Phanerotoma flava]
MYVWMMLSFQDSYSYLSLLMNFFYDFVMMILIMIMIFILYFILWIFKNMMIDMMILHNQLVEIIWTIFPMLILIFMALPSLKILYMFEELVNPFLTIKVLGHQWYWSYEYSDFYNIYFDSYMLNFNNNELFNNRLLDVDNYLVLPMKMNIRLLISSMDVIHSWALPVLMVKVDSVPGRINQIIFNSLFSGLIYGQCSEICGMNHSFMPIVVEVVNFKNFFNWLNLIK